MKAKDFNLVWDESMPMRSMSNSGFGVKFFERQSIYLRFEFESSGLNGLFWGLKSESKAAPHEVAKWADINNLMSIRFGSGGSPTTGAWWLWFRTDTKNHLGLDRNWYNNFQPWSQLMSGMTKDKSVASHIASLACDVQIALGDGVAKLLPEH